MSYLEQLIRRKLKPQPWDEKNPVLRFPPPVQPIARIPVTDSLPPAGFSSPDAGYDNATRIAPLETRPRVVNDSPVGNLSETYSGPISDTRPRTVTAQPPGPVIKLLDDYRNQPLGAEPVALDNQPLLRPTQDYQTATGILGNTIAPMPSPVLNDATTRQRLVQPVDPLLRASENYNAAMTATPDYGQDKYGNQRTHGKEGVLGRTLSGLKGAWDAFRHGGGLIGAIEGGAESAVNTNRNAQNRLLERRAEDAQELGQQIGLAQQQARIGQIQAATDYQRLRPIWEQQKIAQGDQRIAQGDARIQQGNQRLSQAQVAQERQAVLASLRTRPTLDAQRDADLIARARKVGVEVDPENYGKQTRGIWIEGVYSDPYSGQPILRDGKQIVDRTKVPVEYMGYPVTPGTAVSAIGADRRQEREIAATNERQAGNDERVTARQEEANRRAATAQLNLARSKREQAARYEDDDPRKEVLLSDADNIEATVATNYPDVVEQTVPSGINPFAKPTYRIRARGAVISQAAPKSGKYAGQVFPSPASLRKAFPGKTDDEIRKIVTDNQGSFQQ